MKYYFAFLLFSLITKLSPGQVTLQFKDINSGEPLKKIEITGIDDYEVSPNGLINIPFGILNEIDSLIIFNPGYTPYIIYPPFRDKKVSYLSPVHQVIDEVTISVNQTEQNYRKATGSLIYTPATEILNFNSTVFSEQLNQLPGIYVQAGTNNTSRLTIRGIGSRTPYSSNRIRAYLNDMPLTNGNGVTVIEDIDPQLIQSVEVIKGPASVLYGSGLGGILKINTYNNLKENSVIATSQIGSFNSLHLGVEANYSEENNSISLFASNYYSDGYRQNNTYNRNTFFIQAKHNFYSSTLNYFVLYNFLEAGIPSSIDSATFLNHPEQAALNWLDADGYEEYHRLAIGSSLQTPFGKRFKNQLSLSFSYLNPYEVRPFNILDDQSYNTSLSNKLKYYQNNLIINFTNTINYENYKWSTLEEVDSVTIVPLNRYTDNKIHFNSGLMLTYEAFNKLNISAGIGLNLSSYFLKDELNNTSEIVKYNFDPTFSPTVGINYQVIENLNLYTSLSHGFSPPSIEETLLPEGEINTELKPEEGYMFELGLRGSIKNSFEANATVYQMNSKNLLVTKRISEEIFMGVNAGKVKYQGLEMQIMLNSSQVFKPENVLLNLSSSFSISKNIFVDFVDDSIEYSDNYLPGIPSQVWNYKLESTFSENWKITFHYQISGKQYITDDNNVTYDGYKIGNLSFSGRIYKSSKYNIKLTAGVKNILNEHYASMLLVNAPSFGGNSPRYFYPGEPRNYFFGLNILL